MNADLENPGIVMDEQGNPQVVWGNRESVWYGQFDDKQWTAIANVSTSLSTALGCTLTGSLQPTSHGVDGR